MGEFDKRYSAERRKHSSFRREVGTVIQRGEVPPLRADVPSKLLYSSSLSKLRTLRDLLGHKASPPNDSLPPRTESGQEPPNLPPGKSLSSEFSDGPDDPVRAETITAFDTEAKRLVFGKKGAPKLRQLRYTFESKDFQVGELGENTLRVQVASNLRGKTTFRSVMWIESGDPFLDEGETYFPFRRLIIPSEGTSIWQEGRMTEGFNRYQGFGLYEEGMTDQEQSLFTLDTSYDATDRDVQEAVKVMKSRSNAHEIVNRGRTQEEYEQDKTFTNDVQEVAKNLIKISNEELNEDIPFASYRVGDETINIIAYGDSVAITRYIESEEMESDDSTSQGNKILYSIDSNDHEFYVDHQFSVTEDEDFDATHARISADRALHHAKYRKDRGNNFEKERLLEMLTTRTVGDLIRH